MSAAEFISTGLIRAKDLFNTWFDVGAAVYDLKIPTLAENIAIIAIEVEEINSTKTVVEVFEDTDTAGGADVALEVADRSASVKKPFELKLAGAITAEGNLIFSSTKVADASNQTPSNASVSEKSPLILSKDKAYLIRISGTGAGVLLSGNIAFVA